MTVTMIKKRLASGEPCPKCATVEALLRNRGVWDGITRVVWAVEGDAASEGMRLSALHGVSLAPFFIVLGDDGSEQVYTSALKLVRDRFPQASRPGTGPSAPASLSEEALDPQGLTAQFSGAHPEMLLARVLEGFGADCAIAFSGAEDVALIDMAAGTGFPFSVFTLDTGRLHPETLRFVERVREHYRIDIAAMSPDPKLLEPMVRGKGLFSFYEDGHRECCGIRKVEPLRRALGNYRAWITGLRRDQSPATRAALALAEWDPRFEGKTGALLKLNPMLDWSQAQVWQYIRDGRVPHNELHDRGYFSIGCEPCTRPCRPGEHERMARWWWEDATRRECGLHVDRPPDAAG